MFPIDAIKQSRNYTLLADDLFSHLDLLLTDTPYKKLRDEIALELLYHYLYQNNHVPELRVLYTDLCEALCNIINNYCRVPLFLDGEDLHPLVTPILNELDLVFNLVEVNRWGMYTAQVKFDRFEIGYVGDYRIIQWSQTKDANRFHNNPASAASIYTETNHSFGL